MNHRRAFPTAAALRLAAFHGAVALAALLYSPSSGLAALVVSVLALLRYGAMAAFVAGLGLRAGAANALVGAAWLLAGLALAVALVAVALLARPCLPWAVAAALAGPAAFFAEALLPGLRAVAAGKGRAS